MKLILYEEKGAFALLMKYEVSWFNHRQKYKFQ